MKKLYLVITINEDADPMIGDVIGVYTNQSKANKIKDSLLKGEIIKGIDYRSLTVFDDVSVITRNLNETINNIPE